MLVNWIWVMAVQRRTAVGDCLETEPLDLLLSYTWAGCRGREGEPSFEWLTNPKNLSEKWSFTVDKAWELKQNFFCFEGWQDRFIKRAWKESSLVTVMIKIISAQAQQMALYFTAKERKRSIAVWIKRNLS